MADQHDKTRRLTLDELASLGGFESRRTVRYYIQQGLIDRPIGETRAAYYTARHLEQLLSVRKWTEAGLSLDRIRELLHGDEGAEVPPAPPRRPGSVEVRSHTFVADGVELVVEPGRAGLSPEQLRVFFERVCREYEEIKKDGGDDG